MEKVETPKITVSNDLIWGKDASVQGAGSIKSIGNKIYFYDCVSHLSILNLTEQIETVSRNIRTLSIENGFEVPAIELHIGSYGGSVFAGFAGMEKIKHNPIPIHTIVDGAAASAATMLSVVGQKRFMYKNSYMLIHQLSSGFQGKFADFKDNMTNLQKLMDTITQTYKDYTRIPEDELENMLEHDLWFESEKCLRYGLVDDII